VVAIVVVLVVEVVAKLDGVSPVVEGGAAVSVAGEVTTLSASPAVHDAASTRTPSNKNKRRI
jgi:hypothetical protein